MPLMSGPSGPTTVRSTPCVSATSMYVDTSSGTGTQVPNSAMPGFPGHATIPVTEGDFESRHANACSRPPPPTINIFKTARITNNAMQKKYDVIVVGAGHAGCEAARACARLGRKTAMVTMNLDLIAQMSSNPAIGGIAKGHLVREIDARGGGMGELADAVGIQFRLLNTSRGPAVWSPRAQMDKRVYRVRMRELLEKEPNLRIKQAEVAALALCADRRVTGVVLRDGRTMLAAAGVVTTGPFLNGL